MTSRTRSGVASIAWYWRSHLIADSTGQLDSNDAICIAVAAMRPGATNSRYEIAALEIGRAVDEHAEPDAEREQVDDRGDDGRHRRAAPDVLVLREEELERTEDEERPSFIR